MVVFFPLVALKWRDQFPSCLFLKSRRLFFLVGHDRFPRQMWSYGQGMKKGV